MSASGMSAAPREVVVTGIGLLSSRGEGPDAHWSALRDGTPRVDEALLAPHTVHPLAQPDWTAQFSKRDRRQMELWQQIGTYAAGLALDDAGIKGDEALLDRTDMIVAAGGGERDVAVDEALLAEAPDAPRGAYRGTAREGFVAGRLATDLRPTLFLAQLSNLLAGNISIVHRVTGSSRSFMGEEGAGVSAVGDAFRRIGAGQSDIALAGGAYSAERADMALVFALGQYLASGPWRPVWEREEGGSGLMLGSLGAFLVLESREHAQARGATIRAVLQAVAGEQARPDHRADALADVTRRVGGEGADLALSGASGVGGPTRAEAELLSSLALPARAYGSLLGHGVEAHFPLGIALAALCLSQGAAPAPIGNEAPFEGAPESVLVTAMGHWRGEGAALLRAANAAGNAARNAAGNGETG